MPNRWKHRPPGSNWGQFGPDDQLGRLNLLTPAVVKHAAREIREGLRFCLSLPLDLPGGMVLNNRRRPPELIAVKRDGHASFNLPLREHNPMFTDVVSDEAVLLHSQYSTQWDSLGHIGSLFDADGDGVAETCGYNGFCVVGADGRGTQGEVGAVALGIENLAAACPQGRAVMIDLHAHLGDQRQAVGRDMLLRIVAADGVEVREGDFVLIHTGIGQAIVDMQGKPDPALREAFPVLDGTDPGLLDWVTESGVVALCSDALAVEASTQLPRTLHRPGPALPLHEHCLFKLGVHLGELWYLTELAAWLGANGRTSVFLTAPPLRLPGAVGSPATPIATV